MKELRMQRLKLVLAALLFLPLATAACGRQQADTGKGAATGAEQSTPAGERTGSIDMDDVELGKSLGPDGDVKGTTENFAPGDPVFTSLEASDPTPGTNLRLE